MIGDLYTLALSVPWCCTQEALEAILSIAARDPLPSEEIARRMHGPRSLALRRGEPRSDSRTMTMQGPVAVLPIDGPIYRYADYFTAVSGGVTTEGLARDIGLALDDPAVRALLLVVDSPGGEAAGISELSDTIYQARGRKPIVAYAEGYCASAAYWIASAADLLIADSTALIGSIGTVMGVPDPTKRMSYRIDFVSKQSPKKRPDVTTDEGRAVVQQLVDDLTEVFVASVARNRGIDPAAILAVEGGMLVGQQAIEAGLADGLGSEEAAIQALGRRFPPALSEQGPSPLWAAYKPVQTPQALGLGSKEQPMATDQKGFWASFWGGAKEAGIVPEASVEPQPASAPQQPTVQAAPDNETTRLRQEIAKLKAEQIQKDAQAFAKEQIASGHAYPAESQALVALYARAAEMDAASPRSDGQPSCVALLEAAAAARPANSLSADLLAPGVKGIVLTNATGGEDEELAQVRADAEAYAKRSNGRKP